MVIGLGVALADVPGWNTALREEALLVWTARAELESAEFAHSTNFYRLVWIANLNAINAVPTEPHFRAPTAASTTEKREGKGVQVGREPAVLNLIETYKSQPRAF